MQCSAVQYIEVQCSVVQCTAVQSSAVLSSTLHKSPCDSDSWLSPWWPQSRGDIVDNWNIVTPTVRHCNALYCMQYSVCTVLCNTRLHCTVLYSELQCTVLYSAALCTAVYCTYSAALCTAVYCTLPCCTLHCSVQYFTLLHSAVHKREEETYGVLAGGDGNLAIVQSGMNNSLHVQNINVYYTTHYCLLYKTLLCTVQNTTVYCTKVYCLLYSTLLFTVQNITCSAVLFSLLLRSQSQSGCFTKQHSPQTVLKQSWTVLIVSSNSRPKQAELPTQLIPKGTTLKSKEPPQTCVQQILVFSLLKGYTNPTFAKKSKQYFST